MAVCEDEYVTVGTIRNGVSRALDANVPSTALSEPLRELKEPRFGPVLRDVSRPDLSGRLEDYMSLWTPPYRHL